MRLTFESFAFGSIHELSSHGPKAMSVFVNYRYTHLYLIAYLLPVEF